MKLDALRGQDPVMSEYDLMQPYFYNGEDDDHSCGRSYGACLSEEIWKKFELLPTPPLSPEHPGSVDSDSDAEVDKILNSEAATDVDDILAECKTRMDCNASNCIPKYKEVCENNFEEDPKLIKDCMWNGFGHKPRSEVPRRCRNVSPASACHIPASGFVDPRAVFPVAEKADQDKRLDKRRRRSDGGESQSDSEEEIDVVTVEKGSPSTMPRTTTLGVVSHGRKYVGTLVSTQNGRHRQLALVTTAGANRMRSTRFENADKENFDGDKAKHQSKSEPQQTVTMVINNIKAAGGDSKPKAVQLKSLPVVATSVASSKLAATRKFSSPSKGDCTNQPPLVRLAMPTNIAAVGAAKRVRERSPSLNVVGGKRPHLSLEGISMVSNTGIMKHRSEITSTLNSLPKSESPAVQPVGERVYVVSSHAGSVNSAAQQAERKKMSKKVTKPKVATSFDSPTSSPASSVCDSAPSSPKKNRPIIGEANSSGSDEEIRAAHNVLERQRREGLRTSFNNLRLGVPELVDQERAPKVLILKKAKEFSLAMQKEQQELEAEKARLLERNALLQKRLREAAAEYAAVRPVSYTAPVKRERLEVVRLPDSRITDSSLTYYYPSDMLSLSADGACERTETVEDDDDDMSSESDEEAEIALEELDAVHIRQY